MAIVQDDELLQMFVEESKEHLDGIEADFLQIEEMGAEIDSELVNKVFRAIHSVKGGAGFLGLDRIKELAHSMENILNKMRNGQIIPGSELISTLLSALDMLKDLIEDFMESNEIDISGHLSALQDALEGKSAGAAPRQAADITKGKEFAEKQETPQVSDTEKAALPEEDMIEIRISPEQVIFRLPRKDLEIAGQAGRIIYLAKFDAQEDFVQKKRMPQAVLKEIEETGLLLASKTEPPDAPLAEDFNEKASFIFYTLFATVLEEDIVPNLIGLEGENIFRLNEAWQTEALSPRAGKASMAGKPPAAPAKPTVSPDKSKQTTKPQPALVQTDLSGSAPPKKTSKTKSARKRSISTVSTTLRVHVNLLDRLMNLAGELVLTRNQLLQNYSANSNGDLQDTIQRIDLITTEMQEAIMSTRMQPVSVVFNKFQRVVHDMSKELGKQVQLELVGEDVELDKTIIESIGDPLTHLVRNSMDHGIETPDIRLQAGKKLPATLKLSAFHEAGQVLIDVVDDGAGIDPEKVKTKALEMGLVDKAQLETMSENEIIRLIFKPGFSTAQKVTEVSGRGVGMDVVFSNLSKLGGSVEIDSVVGKGTKIHIKLPLTLAIIPSLIIEVQGSRFAIPQVNLVELVRIPAAQIKKRIERLEDAAVLRLRGELLPLIRISDVLQMKRTFINPENQNFQGDRRESIYDRRSPEVGKEHEIPDEEIKEKRKRAADRRKNIQSAYNIVVVNAGELNFGLIVDELQDSEEIVVKPLGRHLRGIHTYAGATILGDGRAALILDIMGISSVMNLRIVKDKVHEQKIIEQAAQSQDAQSLLLLKNAEDEQFAVPLGLVSRLEKIDRNHIELKSGRQTIKYRGGSLLLCSIEEVANVKPRADVENPYVLIFPFAGKEVGIIVSEIMDVVEYNMKIDEETFRQPGILGSAIIADNTTLMLDLYGVVSTIIPEWVEEKKEEQKVKKQLQAGILLVEDSKFFLNQVKGFTEDAGYNVLTALDGVLGLETFNNPENEVDLILTDIEMPNMDGIEMSRQIRAIDPKVPILALTSVAAEEIRQKALKAGVDEYLIKLDREKVLERIAFYLKQKRK